jgi:hypothetical protein
MQVIEQRRDRARDPERHLAVRIGVARDRFGRDGQYQVVGQGPNEHISAKPPLARCRTAGELAPDPALLPRRGR